MASVTKVSDITPQDLADYIRLSEVTDTELSKLESTLGGVLFFISRYTGRSIEDLDNYPDLCRVVFAMVQDDWDNRTLYVGKSYYLNPMVESILGMHSINLL